MKKEKQLPTQDEFVLALLEQGKILSSHEVSMKYGIDRLGSIIHRLRKQGYMIYTEYITKKSKRFRGHITFAKYTLIKEVEI